MAPTTVSGLPTIGDVILAWRKFRGFTSTELVKKAGIKKGYLSALEHNKRANPQEEYLVKLSSALDVPLQDIYGRRMPPKDGGAVTTPSSQQGVARQGGQQVSVDKDKAGEEEEEEQENGIPTYSTASAALGIPDSLLDTLGDQINEIKRLIDSVCLTDEEEEMVASQLDTTQRLLKFIAAHR